MTYQLPPLPPLVFSNSSSSQSPTGVLLPLPVNPGDIIPINPTGSAYTAFTGNNQIAGDIGAFAIAIVVFFVVNSFLSFRESAALSTLLLLAAFAGNSGYGQSVLKNLGLP